MVARWDWWNQALNSFTPLRKCSSRTSAKPVHTEFEVGTYTAAPIQRGRKHESQHTPTDSSRTRTDKTCVSFSFLSAAQRSIWYKFPNQTDAHGTSMSQKRSPNLSNGPSGISESASPGTARTFGTDFPRTFPPIFDETVDLCKVGPRLLTFDLAEID